MMKLWLKRILYRIKYLKKQVHIGSGVELDMHVEFEGKNVIGANCVVAGSNIGLGTYVAGNAVIRKTRIGKFCSIGSNVQTGLGTHPTKKFVSTHPAFFSVQKQAGFSFTEHNTFEEHIYTDADRKYVVEIGNDVWVGNNVIMADGLSIGHGAIIAAGAVVTQNVPPYAIFGGVPARLIRYRFSEEQILALQKIQWWNWTFDDIRSKSNLFANIDDLLAAHASF